MPGLSCEGCIGVLPGVRWPTAANGDTTRGWIERCDTCEVYASDADAAEALRAEGKVFDWAEARPTGSAVETPFAVTRRRYLDSASANSPKSVKYDRAVMDELADNLSGGDTATISPYDLDALDRYGLHTLAEDAYDALGEAACATDGGPPAIAATGDELTVLAELALILAEPEPEPKAKTVWGITSGAYSDWTLECICESEEDAKRAVTELRGSDEPDLGDGYKVTAFGYYPEGAIKVHTIWEASGKLPSLEVELRELRELEPGTPRPTILSTRHEHERGEVRAECADRVGAIKAVKDRLAAMKAESKFGSGDLVKVKLPPMGYEAEGEIIERGREPGYWMVELVGGGRFPFPEGQLRMQ